ncbi:MAG: MBL fold metallo-hydrolase [Nitrospirota bacterium]
MKLTIHRGYREIGGSCIELQALDSRILLDFGLPLLDENYQPFDKNSIKSQTTEDLIRLKVLPDIKGLYQHETPLINGILISHSHQDHYGLLSFVNPSTPIHMSKGCKELIRVSHFFGQTACNLQNIVTIEPWTPFQINSFTVTPYLVDHSAFDALAFLIEGDGKRILYSGDFRGHGRKSILFENILKHPPSDIDYLILEGTMIGRDKGELETELDIENEMARLFNKNEKLFFVAFSSQNIDRIVSIYRACLRSDRLFVIDPYTAFILDNLGKFSSSLPQFDWRNIRVFFVPSSHTRQMAEDKNLFKFKSAKINYEEIQRFKNRAVLRDTYLTRKIFANKNDIRGSILIYSMWEGYLADIKPFWDSNGVPIKHVHTSGHAYIKELKKFVDALKPKHIIPNHTLFPEAYRELFPNVMEVEDGQTVTL